jgi:very-short-patch-repair endonuclease
MTVARTVLDLADVLQRRPTERVFDQAEIAGVLDLNQLNDQLARNPSRPGGKVIRAILDEHYIGSTSTMNDFEEAFLRLTRTLKLPDPEVNTFIVLDDGEPAIQADFVWRAQRVVVETDGRRTHGTRQAFESDRRRDQRLTAAGWRVIRTTWRQLTRRPEELARVLLRVVGSA